MSGIHIHQVYDAKDTTFSSDNCPCYLMSILLLMAFQVKSFVYIHLWWCRG